MCGLSMPFYLFDLECLMIQISKARHYSTLNISETTEDRYVRLYLLVLQTTNKTTALHVTHYLCYRHDLDRPSKSFKIF